MICLITTALPQNISFCGSLVLCVILLYYFTLTTQLAVFPLCVVTVIVAVPAFFAVTLPLELTVATVVSLLLHV